MKRISPFLAAAFLIVGSSVANANPNVEFDGALCLTTVTSQCLPMNWAIGNCAVVRLAPPNLGTNGPPTRLSMYFHGDYAFNVTLNAGSLIGTTFQTVTATRMGTVAVQYSAGARFTLQSPAAPTATTNTIAFLGGINNFDIDGTGRNVSFRGAVTRKP
jgi:hypothetical protein